MKEKNVKHGWFSEQQSKACGTHIYERLEGGVVEVSCVSSDNNHGCHWPDIKFVGKVNEYVRPGKPGLYVSCVDLSPTGENFDYPDERDYDDLYGDWLN